MISIGVIGNGFVGQASCQLNSKNIKVIAYDTRPEACVPIGTTLRDLIETDVVMISVPTPMNSNGECYTQIVRDVVCELNELNYKGIILLRSTVPVGTSDELGVFFMPEFLTEKNFLQDFVCNEEWILGVYRGCSSEKREQFVMTMNKVFETAFSEGSIKSNRVRYVSASEAEMIKMFRNCFLAVKTSFCNEMYQYCKKTNVDYEKVREFISSDKRIGPSHTRVPGPDGHFGFGGTCFPKDLSSLCCEMKKVGCLPYISEAVQKRNETIDRPEKDWKGDKGRAVVEE